MTHILFDNRDALLYNYKIATPKQAELGRNKMALEKLTYSVEEAGELIGVSRNNAYNLAKTGSLPTIKMGKRLLVPKAALEKLLASAG